MSGGKNVVKLERKPVWVALISTGGQGGTGGFVNEAEAAVHRRIRLVPIYKVKGGHADDGINCLKIRNKTTHLVVAMNTRTQILTFPCSLPARNTLGWWGPDLRAQECVCTKRGDLLCNRYHGGQCMLTRFGARTEGGWVWP